jgi:gamma-glutamyltranspeptidase
MGSITPTIVVKNGEPILVTGTYGSAFIPSLVFNVVTNVVDHGMTLQQAVDAPRMWGAVPNVNPPSANFARQTHDQRPGRSSDLTAVASLEVHYNRRERLPPS